MPQFLVPLLHKAAVALIEALVTRLLLQLWTAYARDWASEAGQIG
jgi:hypothetical protein